MKTELPIENRLVAYKHGNRNIEGFYIQNEKGLCMEYSKTPESELLKKGYETIPFKEAMIQLERLNDDICKEWMEIDKETYWEALECLPPEKWLTVEGVNLFRMCEYYTSNITAHYAKCQGRYFTAHRRTSCKYETLASEVGAIAS